MEKSNCWSVMLIDVGTSQVSIYLKILQDVLHSIDHHEPPVGKKSTYLELSVGATCTHLIQNGFEEKHN